MAISSLRSPLSSALSSLRSSSSSAFSVSACEWTDTYSPAAIDIAPATRPATPATNTLLWFACAAATPSTILDVERMPSFAPSTAARSHPMRSVRCRSLLPTGILEASYVFGRIGRVVSHHRREATTAHTASTKPNGHTPWRKAYTDPSAHAPANAKVNHRL